MLSVVDLVNMHTLDLDLAAYLTARVSRGCSFLVGALPGGAGKTTVMAALLNFVPPDCRLATADSGTTVRRILAAPDDRRCCFICHEIGSGPYFAYLWGRDARDFFALPAAGHVIATNLHADTYEQCRAQLCRDVGLAETAFHQCQLCLFIHRVGRSWSDPRRRLVAVYEGDGDGPHRLVWQWNRAADAFDRIAPSGLIVPEAPYPTAMRDFLSRMVREQVYTIEDVRARFLDFAAANPPGSA